MFPAVKTELPQLLTTVTVGADGTGFTVTATGAELGDEQPFSAIYTTV